MARTEPEEGYVCGWARMSYPAYPPVGVPVLMPATMPGICDVCNGLINKGEYVLVENVGQQAVSHCGCVMVDAKPLVDRRSS